MECLKILRSSTSKCPPPTSTGTEENSQKAQVDALKAHGIKNIVFHESQGTAHEWLTWRRALNDFVPRIFK